MVAPTPPTVRATSATTKPSDKLSATAEIAIRARPASPSFFSRKRWPNNPAGNATITPGNKYAPSSMPISE
jgi:hypothetical protein